jgi:soluble lytic murein transglycosylase-like protein
MKKIVIGVFCLFLMSFAKASENQSSSDGNEGKQNCWNSAGEKYNLNPYLLYAIAEKESSLNPLAVNARDDTDEDVGLMQINTFWFPHLKRYGINRSDLFHACTSIHVGAWVLAQSILVFGNTWESVGAYNVGTSKENWAYKAREVYSSDVRRRYFNILERLRFKSTTE